MIPLPMTHPANCIITSIFIRIAQITHIFFFIFYTSLVKNIKTVTWIPMYTVVLQCIQIDIP